MNILVTGCAGMIGSYLTSHLLDLFPSKDGNRIIGIDMNNEKFFFNKNIVIKQ